MMKSLMQKTRLILEMIRFSHTIFALPFAMLAAACVDRVSANLPRVTGARKRVVLGQVCEPEPRR